MNYDPKSSHAEEFIHHREVEETLACGKANRTNRELTDKILAKAEEHRDLTHRKAMVLLDCGLENKNQKIYEPVEQIKKNFYRNHIMLSAPLCLSNHCTNGCVHCLYHAKNKHIPREKLTQDEIRRGVIALQDMGHKRLALETGEDPVHNLVGYILESIDTIYNTKHENRVIHRVDVNIAATTVESYRKLKNAGVGTYILFQEAYHKEGYEKLHPTGSKHDYCYHTKAMDRTQLDGIDDVGCGVLSGLGLCRYEFAGLLIYAEHLEAVFRVELHTISVSRIHRADDIDPDSFDNGIDDNIFAKLVACIRTTVPYTDTAISTRESQKTRERVLYLGISQISGGPKTSMGGYFRSEPEGECPAQFDVSSSRILDRAMDWLMGMGCILSFCMVCYREGRTGDCFTPLCKSEQIQNCCHPNVLMTLKEYLMDYSSEEARHIGETLTEKETGSMPEEKVQQIVRDNPAKIEQSIRDFRF